MYNILCTISFDNDQIVSTDSPPPPSIFFFFSFRADNILKCYICSSMGEEECGNWLNTSTPLPLPQPVECIPEKIRSLTKIKDQHAIIGKYMKYLDIANDQTHYHSGNMVCTKMIFRRESNY